MSGQVAIGLEIPELDIRAWSLEDDADVNGQVWIATPMAFELADETRVEVSLSHRRPFDLLNKRARVHFFRYSVNRWMRLPQFHPGIINKVTRFGRGMATISIVPDFHDGRQNPRYFSHADQSALFPGDLFFANAQKWVDREREQKFIWPTLTKVLPGGTTVSLLPDDIQPILIDLVQIVVPINTRWQNIGNAKWPDSRRRFPSNADVRAVSRGRIFGRIENGFGQVQTRERPGRAIVEFRIRRGDEQAMLIYKQDVFIIGSDQITWRELEVGLLHVETFGDTLTQTAEQIASAVTVNPATMRNRRRRLRIPVGRVEDSPGRLSGRRCWQGHRTNRMHYIGIRVIPTAPEHLPPALLVAAPSFTLDETDKAFDPVPYFDPAAAPFNTNVFPSLPVNSQRYVPRLTSGRVTALDPVLDGDGYLEISAQRTPVGVGGPRHRVAVNIPDGTVTLVHLPPVVAPAASNTAAVVPRLPGWPTLDFGTTAVPRFDIRLAEKPPDRALPDGTPTSSELELLRTGAGTFSMRRFGHPEAGDVWTGYIRGNGETYRYRVANPPENYGALSQVSGTYVSAIGSTLRMRIGQVATVTDTTFRSSATGPFAFNPVNINPEVASIVHDRNAGTITVTASQLGQTAIGNRGAFLVEVVE